MSDSSRLLIYTQDSYGLGHLRRATNLANALVSLHKNLTVLMLVDSPVAPFFDLAERIDFVKLPTIVKVDAGVFRSDQLSIDYGTVNSLRSGLICETIRHFQPHVMLVDHMPGGANNELIAPLKMAYEQQFPTKFVLGLRDIIDDPEITRNLWKREGVYETMERYYDAVMIYSSPDYYPTAEKYKIPNTAKKKVHYCGYVCNMDPIIVRNENKAESKPIVTVIAGGGSDGFHLMNTFLDSLETFTSPPPFASMIVTGPFFPLAQSEIIRERSEKLGVRVFTTLKDTMSHINATDVVVSMAGYNTMIEIVCLRKPAVIVPRPGPSAEQSMRAGLFSERGLVRALNPHNLSGSVILEAVTEMLQKPRIVNSKNIPDMNGVNNAAQILLDLLR